VRSPAHLAKADGRLWKLGLELNRAGGLQDLVVDEVDLAFIKLDLVV